MRKVAIVFIIAVVAPSLVLASLALRSLRGQRLAAERQETLLAEAAAGELARKVEATLSEGTILVLPSGRPAGRVTANLVLGPYQAGAGTPGDVPLAPTQASTQGGRTCFDLPTSADLSLPIAERSLVLCTATRALK